MFRYKRNGRARDFGLGPFPLISLAEARELAVDRQRKLRTGIDPVDERRAARLAQKLERATAMTFQQSAEAYIAAHEKSWKSPKHAAQWPATLENYVYPIFGKLPVATVDTGLVMKVLEQLIEVRDGHREPLWLARTETASRLRGRIEAVLDWATTRGYRIGENPARWKGHLENLLPKKSKVAPVKNHPALRYGELPSFMTDLAQQDGIGALALRFCILTAARTSEVLKAQWAEFSLTDKLWTIPAARMKAGREHRVPLSASALEILAVLKKLPATPYVFPANRARPVSNMIMLMTLRRMERGDLTVHGFRSTFSDWSAERTNFPSEVREMALAHQVDDKVEAAYRRGDLFQKRRALMDAWAKFATSPSAQGAVVPLHAGGRQAP